MSGEEGNRQPCSWLQGPGSDVMMNCGESLVCAKDIRSVMREK